MAKGFGRKKTGWLLLLFGMPFLGVGVGVMLWAFGMWRLHFRSESWVKTPALVQSVEFETHRSSSSSGGSSTSYSVDCTYRYEFNGKSYRGTRVGLEGSGGSSDSYHHDRYNTLKKHRDQKRPFSALVNPEDPNEALLFRDLTTTLWVLPVFGFVFGLAGLGVMSGGFVTLVRGSQQRALLARFPDQPWMADKRWHSSKLQGKPLANIMGSFALALFTAAFMSMFVIVLAKEKNAPFFAKAIVGILCLIPVGACISGVYYTLRYLEYGNPTLALTRMPCVIGEENTVLLYVRSGIVTDDGVDVRISCLKKEWVKHGNKSSLSETSVYTDELKVREDMGRRTSRSSAIPIIFNIPKGKPETYGADYPSYRWRLVARAKTPGVDFHAEFDIPVYDIGDQA